MTGGVVFIKHSNVKKNRSKLKQRMSFCTGLYLQNYRSAGES